MSAVEKPISLHEIDAEHFREWLVSLPPDSTLPDTQTEEPFILWLRETDPAARLLEDAEGSFQEFMFLGEREEVPGCFFYFYDFWNPEWTIAEGLANWDAYLADDTGDYCPEWLTLALAARKAGKVEAAA